MQLLQLAQQARVAAAERLLPDVDERGVHFEHAAGDDLGVLQRELARCDEFFGERSGGGIAHAQVVLAQLGIDPHRLHQCGRAGQLGTQPRHAFDEGVDPGRPLRAPADAGQQGLRRAQATFGLPLKQGEQDCALVGEVLVERRDVDAGRLRDRVRVDALEAELVEELRRGIEDVIEGCLPTRLQRGTTQLEFRFALARGALLDGTPRSARRTRPLRFRLRCHVPSPPLASIVDRQRVPALVTEDTRTATR